MIFTTTSQSAEESRGTLVAVLELNSVATDLVTIPFSTTGTAVQGVDYTITASPVTISPGNKTATIYITLINDGIEEGNEALFIGINSPTNATKGPQNIHMITLVDPPFVSFTLADSIKPESESTSRFKYCAFKRQHSRCNSYYYLCRYCNPWRRGRLSNLKRSCCNPCWFINFPLTITIE